MNSILKTALFLSFLIAGLAASSFAQTFPCDNGERLYFFQDAGSANGSLAYITNYTTSSPVVTTLFPMPNMQHNGLAANPADNYLYYLEMNQLMRLDASGSAVNACALASSSLYGCFDYLGRYWTVQMGDLVAYDINSCSVVKGPYPLAVGSGFLDIAFNPKDCHFYIGDERIDTNGVADPTYAGTLFTPSGTYGGVAIGSDGNIYGLAGTTANGILSMIDISGGTSHQVFGFNPGPTAAKSDMASFPCAVVTAHFTDSLTGCGSQNVFFSDSSSGPVGSWSWDFGDPASGPANTSVLQHPSHGFSSAGTYTVTLLVSTGNNMCYLSATDTATMIVTVSPSGLSLNLNQVNIPCNGTCSGAAFVSVNNGNAPYSYVWNTGHTTSAISALCAGSYSITVVDAGGCSQTGTVVVTSSGTGPTVLLNGNTSICKGDSVLLTASGGAEFLWNTGETTSNISVSPQMSAMYSVTTWLNGCSGTATISISVADLLVDLGEDMDLCGKDEVVLNAEDIDASFQWSTGQTSPEISITEPGIYWLAVSNGNCKASDTVEIKGDAPGGDALYIPNSFTPGMDGLNDVFTGKGENVVEFHMQIFNRWGQLIFETNDLMSGWDGKCRSTLVQEDVYIYKISYRTSCSGKRAIEKTGHVSVVK